MGPVWETTANGLGGEEAARPWVGLMPNPPVKELETPMEPPPSLPRCSGPMPVAAATAAPALLPPGVCCRSHGLRVMPVSGLSPMAFQPNSGVVVLPRSTAPASRRRATMGASSFQGWSRGTDFEPRSVGHPSAIITSFTLVGTPSTGPAGVPLIQRAYEAREAASAAYSSISRQAFSDDRSWRLRASPGL